MRQITTVIMALFVMIIASQQLYADSVSVISNSSSGIANATYTASLDDGSVLGFYRSGSNCYFCGAISSASSLSVPENIIYNGSEYTVNYCGYRSGNTLDFDEATSVTSLTLPATITNIYNYVPASVSDLHLLGTTPPSIYGSSYIPSSTTVYVPKSAYRTYQNYCNNGYNSWSTSIDLKVEGWEPQSYTITINTAGTLANLLLAVVDQWTDVDELTIIGRLNAEDMKIFSRMTQLRKLDLSQTDITIIEGCAYLSKLETVLLPSTVKIVGSNAFRECVRLKDINLNNIEEIANYAFYSCCALTSLSLSNAQTVGSFAFAYEDDDHIYSNLRSLSLPVAKTIGYYAFNGNMKLSNVDIPQAVEIGDYAFANCHSIKTIDLSSATSIGYGAFYMYSNNYSTSQLSSVVLSNELTVIPSSCFSGCYSLSAINFPTSLTTIGSSAIPYLAMDNVVIPEGVVTIGMNNFTTSKSISIPSTAQSIGWLGGSNLQDVYCYLVVPPTNQVFSDTYAGQATLHVPAFSVAAYKLDDNWYKFGSIVAMDGTIDKLNISTDFTIVDYTGLADKVELTMTNGAHLTVSAGSAFNLGTFTQSQSASTNSGDYYYDDWGNRVYYGGCSTLIASNEMKADDINLRLQVQTNRWNFISLPFDVKMSDIEYPEGTLWVIRKYSGADRAALTGNTWQNMTDGMVLQAGEGYILHCANENTSSVEFVFHPVNNAKKNNIFAYRDVVQPLSTYVSEHAHNRSWNLVGNPYPAFFDIHGIEHNGVITVYNGNNYSGSYTAYSLLDDDYVLRPNEAFFVQCPPDATSMTFKAVGRKHEYSSINSNNTPYYVRPFKTPTLSNRKVYNLFLSSGELTDRARIVINPEAKMDYEISCDASKFMSDDPSLPQLYVIDGGIRYAIDERPLGNGIINLGARFGQTDEYTISLKDNPTEGMNIMLYDNETGTTTNLSEGCYSFTAQTGTCESRFTITFSDDATSIETIDHSALSIDNNNNVYNLAGQRLNTIQSGVNIINGKKLIVK